MKKMQQLNSLQAMDACIYLASYVINESDCVVFIYKYIASYIAISPYYMYLYGSVPMYMQLANNPV